MSNAKKETDVYIFSNESCEVRCYSVSSEKSICSLSSTSKQSNSENIDFISEYNLLAAKYRLPCYPKSSDEKEDNDMNEYIFQQNKPETPKKFIKKLYKHHTNHTLFYSSKWIKKILKNKHLKQSFNNVSKLKSKRNFLKKPMRSPVKVNPSSNINDSYNEYFENHSGIGFHESYGIFGVSLSSLIQEMGTSSITKFPENLMFSEHKVPLIFKICVTKILEKGLETPGLFRINGSRSVIRSFIEYFLKNKSKISSELDIENLKINANIHDFASLIKKLLVELPGGIIGNKLQLQALFPLLEDRASARVLMPPDVRARMFALALSTIEDQNRFYLACSVFALLRAVATSTEQKERFLNYPKDLNYMKPEALGLVFAPTLLGKQVNSSNVSNTLNPAILSQEHSGPLRVIKEEKEKARQSAKLIETIIDYWEQIVVQLKILQLSLHTSNPKRNIQQINMERSNNHDFYKKFYDDDNKENLDPAIEEHMLAKFSSLDTNTYSTACTDVEETNSDETLQRSNKSSINELEYQKRIINLKNQLVLIRKEKEEIQIHLETKTQEAERLFSRCLDWQRKSEAWQKRAETAEKDLEDYKNNKLKLVAEW